MSRLLHFARKGCEKSIWENHLPFRDALGGNPVTIMTFSEMVAEIQAELTTTLAATEVGRMLQLFSAAGMAPPGHNTPSRP